MSTRSHRLNEQAFDGMDTEEHWYWLGFLLADGGFDHDARGVPHLARKRVRLDPFLEAAA